MRVLYYISNEETLNPSRIMKDVMIQVNGSGPQCVVDTQHQTQIYASAWLDIDPASHLFSCQNLLWSDTTGMNMVYNDLHGNHYMVFYQK